MAIRKAAVLALCAAATLLAAACDTGHAPLAPLVVSPVVYVQHSPGWQLIDWTGKADRLIGSDHVGIPYQSPDGSRVLWQAEGDWQVVDRNGKVTSHSHFLWARAIA